MATLLNTLEAVSSYPIPEATIQEIALSRGMKLDTEATTESITSQEFRLAKADVQLWLSTAPNVTQSGITINLDKDARESLKSQANAVYGEYGDPLYEPKPKYGYKGGRL